MNTRLRGGAVAVAAAVSLAVGLGACGQAGQSGGSGGNATGKHGLTIGLLLPENQTARYENSDRPFVEKKIKDLCRDCTVEYANARNDAATQHQQVNSMISKGVDVLILGSVDRKSLRSAVTDAKKADIPVVAYDRLVEGPVSAFVTYRNKSVNKAMGEALLKALGDKADGGQIVRIVGPATAAISRGATSVLEGKVKIKTYETSTVDSGQADALMSHAIEELGAENIDGVWAANDTLAAGVISALKAAHIKPLPPVVGQDAELAALQRIVTGQQYATVYKPFKPEADAVAEIAVALGRGEKLGGMAKDRINSPTSKDIPAVLLTPVTVTAHNIKNTVVKDGAYTINQICTPQYRTACKKAGLTK